ncbi:molybdate ABC transporter substrate-binding protein [Sessilibacter sp. MAH4]
MSIVRRLMALAVGLIMIKSVCADEVHVAVAANFTAAMKEAVVDFEQKSNHKVIVSFGSSGKIYSQIKNGAPYQVFLSADQTKPELLENEGLTVAGSRFTYAIGALALWSAKENFIDDQFTVLKSGTFNKLALANPKLAPYGAAALEVLEALNLTQQTNPKLVKGDNIAQTYQFVATGNADLGFVALSQIMNKGQLISGSSWIVPTDLYSPIRQDAVLLENAQNNQAALDLLTYLKSDAAREIIHSYGYKTQ